jgi:SAM-dependent methyltransferase
MRYFDRAELARRYQMYRPSVHTGIVKDLSATRRMRARNRALDVACGTGHSTAALAALAATVYGCDVSRAMLAAARLDAPSARFVCSAAERLPFPQRTFDLVTVAMAFHWFDQRVFLEESARVLVPGGELWVYNLFFTGVLTGDEGFRAWHRDRYLARYPAPPRHPNTLARTLQSERLPLELADERPLHCEVGFTAGELRNYLTTQSNIEAALRGGVALGEVDAWLDAELAPFFADEPSRRFFYTGLAEMAVAV